MTIDDLAPSFELLDRLYLPAQKLEDPVVAVETIINEHLDIVNMMQHPETVTDNRSKLPLRLNYLINEAMLLGIEPDATKLPTEKELPELLGIIHSVIRNRLWLRKLATGVYFKDMSEIEKQMYSVSPKYIDWSIRNRTFTDSPLTFGLSKSQAHRLRGNTENSNSDEFYGIAGPVLSL